MSGTDTIVAAATAWGTAAVAMVRVSGPRCAAVLESVAGRVPPPRRATRATFGDAEGGFDDGLVVWMPGPASYTGEDCAELSCHGNPLLVERLVAACLAAGARLARAGEFTRRAVEHGKLDLLAAEAVGQAIEASSAEGLRVARAGLDGRLGAAVSSLRDRLAEVAATLEALLDYPGEDLLFPSDEELGAALAAVGEEARALAGTYASGRLAVEGATVALVGPVNAGKSSLFNTLLGRRRALVSPRPGTTRDVVEAVLALPELKLRLLDTAGDRETDDALEAEGLELAREALPGAALVLFLWPGHVPWAFDGAWERLAAVLPPEVPVLRVCTHADLGGPHPAPVSPDLVWPRDGVEAVRAAILARLAAPGALPGLAIASLRQKELLLGLAEAVDTALADRWAGPAVMVEALYGGLRCADALVGRDTREDVLDRLFARFCVGK